MLGRCWCEIDLSVIRQNFEFCAKKLLKGQKIMAVVKADAYGHGGTEIAKVFQGLGCGCFAVATLQEGVNLRKNGIGGEILILGYTPKEEIKKVFEYDLCQSLYSTDYAEILKESGLPIKVHIAVDTGMNRLGFGVDDGAIADIEKYAKGFQVKGVYTHLSSADDLSCDTFTKLQIENFKRVVKSLSFNPQSVHYANSQGFFRFNDGFANIVRLGICLYGLGEIDGVKPVLTWKSAVTSVKEISQGESVGYGRAFIAPKNMKIATLSCGYADGYRRELSNKGKVVVNGTVVPVVGKICMDSFMVDVSDVEGVKVGDEAVLLCEKYSANDMAKSINTIDYEVVTGISQRVVRLYR